MITRNHFLLATALVASSKLLFAQESVGGMPFTLRAGMDAMHLPELLAAPFDANATAIQDAQREANGDLPLYSRFCALDASLDNSGEWDLLPNGDRIWRLRITSTGAQATELFYRDFHLPENAVLYVYAPDGSVVSGGFTAYNNQDHGLFTSALIPGPTCVVEYYEPLAVAGQGHFTIDRVGHAYRWADDAMADACEVDVKCSEANAWWQQRDGVVRLSVTGPDGSGWCSGSVVNNVEQDCTPYILTAYHCGLPSALDNFALWKAVFRYQRTGCGTGTASTSKSMTGCVKKACSNDNGGDTGSDFLLIQMTSGDIPDSYAPYFNGWSAVNASSTGGVGIHHPAGSEKKISTYTGTTTSSNWGSVGGTHWLMHWVGTANGWGVTEGGSSGSPLFNNAGLIMGTLTGGSSCCVVNGCGLSGSGPTQPDLYGKVSYHWDSNGSIPDYRLKDWLDPNNTGATTLQGSYDPCGTYSAFASINEEAPIAAADVHPNPAIDEFTVEFTATADVDRIEVLDLSGRIMYSIPTMAAGPTAISTRDWANGSYLVRLVSKGSIVAGARVMVTGR